MAGGKGFEPLSADPEYISYLGVDLDFHEDLDSTIKNTVGRRIRQGSPWKGLVQKDRFQRILPTPVSVGGYNAQLTGDIKWLTQY